MWRPGSAGSSGAGCCFVRLERTQPHKLALQVVMKSEFLRRRRAEHRLHRSLSRVVANCTAPEEIRTLAPKIRPVRVIRADSAAPAMGPVCLRLPTSGRFRSSSNAPRRVRANAPYQFWEVGLEALLRPLLISSHQARIARHIAGKDRCEARGHVLPGGKVPLFSLPQNRRCPYGACANPLTS